MTATKLIILRGPSGSGKTTVARELFKTTKRKTVLLEQDYYRFIFKPAGLADAGKDILFSSALIALSHGYDVILEGILTTKSYGKYFERLISVHPDNNYMFYFDISFEETLRRHTAKPKLGKFGEKEMRQWYKPRDYSGHDFEQIIPEASTLKQTVVQIRNVTKS